MYSEFCKEMIAFTLSKKMMSGFTNLFKKADKKAQKLEDRFSRQKSEIKATLARMTKLDRCMKDIN